MRNPATLFVLAITACQAPPARSLLDFNTINGPSAFVLTLLDSPASLAAGAGSGVRVSVQRLKGTTEAIAAVQFGLVAPPPGIAVTGTLAADALEISLALTVAGTTPLGMH